MCACVYVCVMILQCVRMRQIELINPSYFLRNICIVSSIYEGKPLNPFLSIEMHHGRRDTGAGREIAPPPIFCQPPKIKSLKITTYKSM